MSSEYHLTDRPVLVIPSVSPPHPEKREHAAIYLITSTSNLYVVIKPTPPFFKNPPLQNRCLVSIQVHHLLLIKEHSEH